MKAAFVLCAILLPLIASAQGLPVTQPLINAPSHTTGGPELGSDLLFPSSTETPTMRRQKLERAKALRVEVDQLLRVNGGTLTVTEQAYVRRKARDILN